MTLGCKDIGITKSEFMAKTQFPQTDLAEFIKASKEQVAKIQGLNNYSIM